MNTENRTFISYATKYDMYRGTKNWNELTLAERTTIAKSEFLGSDIDIEDYIINTGLKKLQAQGLRSMWVSAMILCEDMRLTNRNSAKDSITKAILKLIENTKLHNEISALLNNTATEGTTYTGIELERLAQSGMTTSILDDMHDMNTEDAHEFLVEQLEPLKIQESSPLQKTASPAPLPAPKTVPRSNGWGFLDLFRCAEVRWIRSSIKDFFARNQCLNSQPLLEECLKIASDADRAKYTIRVDRLKPEQIALMIIGNVAFRELSSGLHHVYRGTLSLTGSEYKKIFIQANQEGVALGFQSQKEADEDLEALRRAVAQVG